MSIVLTKGQKGGINLSKTASSQEVLINLNWNASPKEEKKGFFAKLLDKKPKGIDLDLGCLYELKNGRKGCVQALGNAFGSLNNEPYVALDGDDRSGNNTDGENLRVNGVMIDQIKRILVYAFIYEGVPNWAQTDAVVTLKCSGNEDIIVRMDEFSTDKTLCGLALLENTGSGFSVEKIVQFYNSQRYLDEAFGWGMSWTAGRK
jgi:tellurite resistance protein TerA